MHPAKCTVCGCEFLSSSPSGTGFQLAVHLHDEHPDCWEEVLESTRKDLEIINAEDP